MQKRDKKSSDAQGLDSDAMNNLDAEIEKLKTHLKVLESNRGRLDTHDLSQLADVSADLEYRAALVDRLYQRRGLFYSVAVKLPLKVLNVGSLSDSHQFMRDSIRGVTSPICVMCNAGILMHRKDQLPVNGQVLWFCSNDTACSFTIWAASSNKDLLMSDVRQKISKDILAVGQYRWGDLSESEKQSLIDGHLSKAIMLKRVSLVLFALALFEVVMGYWWALLMLTPVLGLSLLMSIKWCYRAWQIKTGNVFLPNSMFMDWLKTAKEYYSVDWVDQENNKIRGERDEEGGAND